jgi:hypothetical protein
MTIPPVYIQQMIPEMIYQELGQTDQDRIDLHAHTISNIESYEVVDVNSPLPISALSVA